jgi:hypothetical protein
MAEKSGCPFPFARVSGMLHMVGKPAVSHDPAPNTWQQGAVPAPAPPGGLPDETKQGESSSMEINRNYIFKNCPIPIPKTIREL